MSTSSTSDRRHSERVHRHQHAEVEPPGGARSAAQIMNISDGGIRLVSSCELPAGSSFTLYLDGQRQPCLAHECKSIFKGYAIRAAFADKGCS